MTNLQITIDDITVNRLGFGAMRITGPGIWGEPDDVDNALSVLKRAVELGVNFIDTADAYGPRVSEELIARALYPYDGIVIATKGGLVREGPGIWKPNCSPKHLREACEASLKRLKLEVIDLYQLHTVDPEVTFEESYKTLLELQKEGKIRHIGLSNIEPENFEIALQMGKFVSVQNNYNVFNREHEDILRMCEANNIAFIAYFPIAGDGPDKVDTELLNRIATNHQASPRQVALAWLLNHSDNILPIPGTSSITHLEENIDSTKLQLEVQEINQLDSISINIS